MTQITVNQLTFDVTTQSRQGAFALQNRLSALAARVEACLESVLEDYDDPDYTITVDRLEVHPDAVRLDDLEGEILRALASALQEQFAMRLHRLDAADGSRPADAAFSKETRQDHARRLTRYFLDTGIAADHATVTAVTSDAIKQVLAESPSLRKWLMAAQAASNDILTRLLYHLDDSELHALVLGDSFLALDRFQEYLGAVRACTTAPAAATRFAFWRATFRQRNEGRDVFDLAEFLQSDELRQCLPLDQFFQQVSAFGQAELLRTGLAGIPGTPMPKTAAGARDDATGDIASSADAPQIAAAADRQRGDAIGAERDPLTSDTPGPISDLRTPAPNERAPDDPAPKVAGSAPAGLSGDGSSPEGAVVEPAERDEYASAGLSADRSAPEDAAVEPADRDEYPPAGERRPPDQVQTPIDVAPADVPESGHRSDRKRPTVYLDQPEEPKAAIPKRLYVHNAGIVLVAPFLGTFFKNLGLVADGRFVSGEEQARAVVLLHYFHSPCEISEAALVLHKLLCGVDINRPVPVQMEPDRKERSEIQELLRSLIRHWSTLKNTSVESFQHNFLNRKATLTNDDAQWRLFIQRESIDVLLSTLPWSIDVIKHEWMPKPIMVEW